MVSSSPNTLHICSQCGSPLSPFLRHCPTCSDDAGAPNVRACRTVENKKALDEKYENAHSQAKNSGCLKEFYELESLLKEKSGVVVTMDARVARNLVEDPNFIYNNYDNLVGSGIRKPALPENDRHRTVVGGSLFGSYAKDIIYGALSLTDEGLSTYGTVFCRLRSVTIDKRTSFLVMNSYNYVKEYGIKDGCNIPHGHRACWLYRHNLALAKMSDHLSTGQTESDWQGILIQSDGKERMNDVFVEAHIFDRFDINAIDSMVADKNSDLSRGERLDLELAISLFESRRRNS